MSLPPFQRLMDDHGDDVWRFLVAAVGPSEADDCWQETFFSALRAYPRADGANLRAWVFTIAQRKAIDVFRTRKRSATPMESLPEKAVHNDHGEPDLWRLVAAVPMKQRMAVLHRFVLDMPYAEIGAVIGCSEDAARQNVRAGLRRLREVSTG